MAKAGLENALWDAEATQKQQPLWKLLGGTRKEILCGVSIGIQDSIEQLLDKTFVRPAERGEAWFGCGSLKAAGVMCRKWSLRGGSIRAQGLALR